MKLENSLQNKQVLLIQLCLITFAVLLFLKTFSFSLIFLAGVLFCTVVLVTLQFPQIIVFFFIFTFFTGVLFYRFYNLGISLSEVLLPFVCIALISQAISSPKNTSLGKEFNLVSYGFWLIIIMLITSLIVNLPILNEWFITNGIMVILKFIEYYLVFLLITYICDSKTTADNLIFTLLIFSVLQFPIVIFQNFNSSVSNGSISRTVIGTMSYHHGMIGTYMLIPLGLSVGLFFKTKRFSSRVNQFIISLILLIQIILSTARSSLMGVFGALIIFCLIRLRFNVKYLISVISILILGLLLYFFTPIKSLANATFNSNTSNGIDVSSLSRLYIWKGGLDFFIHSELKTKLIGIGPGAYQIIPYKGVIENGLRHAFGGHNNFLTVACETGLLGLFLFLFFWAIVLKVLYTNRHDTLAMTYFYVTIAMLISGFTQETFWATAAFFNLWTLYFIGLAIVLKSASFTGEKNVV